MIMIFFFYFSKILIFWVVRRVKGQKMTQNDKKKICCAPYLSNHTSYDLHLWYISVKWWYSQAFFSFFSILLLQVVSGVKVQKWPKMTTNSVCGTPSLRNHISYDFHLRYTFVKWYLQAFFSFLQTFDFLGC